MANDSRADAADDPKLRINRLLNLDLAEDRQELLVACAHIPALHALVDEHLDSYLKWFRAPEWHKVYSGGMISGPEPQGTHSRMSSSVERLMDLTAKLAALHNYPGFDDLVAGFENPSRISSTMFEVEVASWCKTRLQHRAFVFSPPVKKRLGTKHPDFLWETGLGGLYCECKQLNAWQRSETQRVSTLMATAAEKMGDAALWPTDLRIEIVIRAGLRSDGESRLRAAVEQQANAVRSGHRPPDFDDTAFTVGVRDRADSLYALPDSITIYQVQVGPTPVLLTDFRSAHLVVTASIGMARVRSLRNFVKEAKQQLPESGPGGVFIEIPGGVDAAADKLNEMLGHPAHQAITWASIWTGGVPVRAVWRASENFDERLIEPATRTGDP